jgi:hypothetical protein
MRIELLPQARDALDICCDKRGMTKVAVVSRVVEWLVTQQDLIQAGVLGLYPYDIRAEVAQEAIRNMVKSSDSSKTIDQVRNGRRK